MTSTLPPTNGVHYNEGFYLDNSAETLAEILKGEGYSTGAVMAAIVLDRISGISQGFDHYDDDFPAYIGYQPFVRVMERQLDSTQRRANEVTDLALDLAVSMAEESPFFLMAHYFDPHAPQDPPPPYSLVNPQLTIDSEELLYELYDGEIAFTDEQIGRLIKGLESNGLLENTLVVLTADHGEALGDHGEKSHAFFAYEGSMHVPLIISWPGKLPGGEVYPGLARHIDIVPTVMDIMGIKVRREHNFQGQSLFPFEDASGPDFSYLECATPFVVFNWGALRGVKSTDWKYISAPHEELYDLAGDSREENNLIDRFPRVADSLRQAMEGIVSDIDIFQGEAGQEMSSGRKESLDNPVFEERLRALGYIGAPSKIESGYEEMFDWSLPDPKEKLGDFQGAMNSNLSMRMGLAYTMVDSLDKAVAHLNAAIEEFPENVDAHVYLGLAYRNMLNYEQAREKCEDALDIKPLHIRAHLALTDILLLQEDSVAARSVLDEAFAIGRLTPIELEWGSRLWDRLGARERAIDARLTIMALDPTNIPSRLLLGEDYLLNEDYGAAFSYLEPLAGDMDDGDSLATRAYYGLGRCYYNQGDLEKATEAFQKVIALDSTVADGYNQLGLIYDDLGEYGKAISHYRRALELNQEMIEVHSNLGVTYYKMGQFKESRIEFEEYLTHVEDKEETDRLRAFLEQIKDLERSGN
jgi:arylsulfatase A-like enzyme/Tfp pilus assembly protein PilF